MVASDHCKYDKRNKNVLSFFLKIVSVKLLSLSEAGSSFHKDGAATRKARPPTVLHR